ncbi:MAG: tryptophan synthase subunit alpha [Succinivibrio sp.]|nr:tryptophan synthase subunit alpha [Succinivibrio sp.]
MSQRFADKFSELSLKHEGAFVPFVTLCDPDYETSLSILKTLVESGADALELGFPFSDPCADGPVIQKANKRALSSGARTADFFHLIGQIRQLYPTLPISILVYSNVVVARGIDKFYADAQAVGLDAVLIPDVPFNMLSTQDDFCACARRHEVNVVLICPPNASDHTIRSISGITQGYTYMLSRFGITGTDYSFGQPVEVIKKLKEYGAAPSLLGFGISTPEDAKIAMQTGVAGIIAGSACEKIIERQLENKTALLSELSAYVKAMKAATRLS